MGSTHFSHDTAIINLFSTTKVYTSACGRTCDMGRPERRERERKAAARTCHSLYAFFSPTSRDLTYIQGLRKRGVGLGASVLFLKGFFYTKKIGENISNSFVSILLRVMLQLACTLPVTSYECERSASTMRRLHTYMPTSMTQERLSSLALLHIHYDVPIDRDEAVNIYSRLHPRRLALDSLIKP